ncbi:MAG: hypothetical protein LBC75_13560 [Fibromonadaceae bacterium]|jgi:hypothetical protein|nr:hypothetical protein [Fibromonadaceae bacterium]
MKKSMLTPAILICSMMMFPVNANAFWLDIVKEFIAGGIKTIVMPKKITSALAVTETKPAKPAAEAPKTNADPAPEDIFEALNKLNNICMEISKSVPCSIGEGRGLSTGMARDKALAKARIEMANSIGTYVDNNTKVDAQSDMDDAGVFKETENFLTSGKLKTEQFVSGAHQYMSYTYIDEAGTELNKGRAVYVTTIVMVMNPEIFGKALEDVSKNKPLSDQIIRESRKGMVAILRTAIKKI